PGQLISVATVTLLVTDLEGAGALYQELGDARAFELVHEQIRLLDERVRREGGAIVKAVGEGVVAAFGESVSAVRAGVELANVLESNPTTRGLPLRAGIHRGAALAATINDNLDYFGTTVNVAAQLPGLARAGELILSDAVAGDPQVAALLQGRGLVGELMEVPGAGLAHRIRLRTDPG